MKKIITLSCFCTLFVVLFLILGSQSSCQKPSTNCPCVVTVKDSNDNPLSNVTVKLYAPHSTAGAIGITNGAGDVNFNFSLPAIYNITATKALGQNDTLHGSGIIQLQVGQTENTTVIAK